MGRFSKSRRCGVRISHLKVQTHIVGRFVVQLGSAVPHRFLQRSDRRQGCNIKRNKFGSITGQRCAFPDNSDNRLTYMSNYSPGNAPEGKTSLMAEVTWPMHTPFPGEQMEREVLAGFTEAGLLDPAEVLFTDRSTVSHAYVVFDHDYDRRRDAALQWMESQGLIPLGRFGRYEYDNSDQCVIKSRELARKLLPELTRG